MSRLIVVSNRVAPITEGEPAAGGLAIGSTYSKRLRQRFQAFERYLADHPESRGQVVFTQIAPPSRGDIETYRVCRRRARVVRGADRQPV